MLTEEGNELMIGTTVLTKCRLLPGAELKTPRYLIEVEAELPPDNFESAKEGERKHNMGPQAAIEADLPRDEMKDLAVVIPYFLLLWP